MRAIAPDIAANMVIWRPMLATPPIYSLADFQKLSMRDVLEANQHLDLRDEIEARTRDEQEKELRKAEAKGRR